MKTENLFDSIRFENENIVWAYKPDLLTYLISYRQLWFGFGFSFLFVCAMFISEIFTAERMVPWYFFPIFLSATIVLTMTLIIRRILQHFTVAYALSEQRVLIREGVFWSDIKAIDLKSVKKVEIKRDLLNYLGRTGDIRFYTDTKSIDELGLSVQSFDQLNAVKDPNGILRIIGRVSGKG